MYQKMRGGEYYLEKLVNLKILIDYTKPGPKPEAFVELTLNQQNSDDLDQLVKELGIVWLHFFDGN